MNAESKDPSSTAPDRSKDDPSAGGDASAPGDGRTPVRGAVAEGAGGRAEAGGGDRFDAGPEDGPPPVPEELEDTGLTAPTVSDLLLKTLYRSGARKGRELEDALRIPFSILDDLLLDLQQRHLVEVRGTEGHGRQGYVLDLTGEGRDRAREALTTSRYVGPAPVPFDEYVAWVESQSIRDREVSPREMRRALSHLVLGEDFIDAVGAAVNAAASLFLYGNPGNGKTAVARSIAALSGETIYVPHAVTVEGNAVLQIFDPVFHHPVESDSADDDAALLRSPPSHDQRFVLVERPAVIVGGELTMEDLDLRFDEQAGVYRAPVQLKANGGVFVIDDFGRQRVRARDLLNRWMVPLEHHVDYLTLPTGHKLPVPFDTLLVFATNLDPLDLVEEAFLRRLRYKIEAPDPTREQYEEIFREYCDAAGLEFVHAAVDMIYQDYYDRMGLSPRAVHPRDLVAHILEEARYRGEPPEMDRDSVERACRSYFLHLSRTDASGDRKKGVEV